jgi:hypothetical protein
MSCTPSNAPVTPSSNNARAKLSNAFTDGCTKLFERYSFPFRRYIFPFRRVAIFLRALHASHFLSCISNPPCHRGCCGSVLGIAVLVTDQDEPPKVLDRLSFTTAAACLRGPLLYWGSANPATVGALWIRGSFAAFVPGKEPGLNAGQISRMSEVETVAVGWNLDP